MMTELDALRKQVKVIEHENSNQKARGPGIPPTHLAHLAELK